MEHITFLPELLDKIRMIWENLKAGDPATVIGTVIGSCITILGGK